MCSDTSALCDMHALQHLHLFSAFPLATFTCAWYSGLTSNTQDQRPQATSMEGQKPDLLEWLHIGIHVVHCSQAMPYAA